MRQVSSASSRRGWRGYVKWNRNLPEWNFECVVKFNAVVNSNQDSRVCTSIGVNRLQSGMRWRWQRVALIKISRLKLSAEWRALQTWNTAGELNWAELDEVHIIYRGGYGFENGTVNFYGNSVFVIRMFYLQVPICYGKVSLEEMEETISHRVWGCR